ncbi:MAG: CoA-acylating methylmalonate-semialdehyde dehydrogenase [Gemmatimonadota bacterium]
MTGTASGPLTREHPVPATGELARPVVAPFIGGRSRPDITAEERPVYDPSTGQVARLVAFSGADGVAAAVADARAAFSGWSAVTPLHRARVMFRFRELIENNAPELARLISVEHGKVLADARGEVQRGLEVVEFCCGIPHLIKGEFSEAVGSTIDSWSLRQPLGVCSGITPFNFPVMVPLWMAAPAIACGNTFVLKPSEKDPSATVRLAELLIEAGAPPGVLNVVHGNRTEVGALLAHPDVRAVSFVGSTPIAHYIYETAASQGKRVQAMGGAKNHLVVLPDADLDQAVDGLMGAAYGSAGERCMAVSVAVAVGRETGDALVAGLADRVRSLRVGPSLADGVDMGPLVTAEHRARVMSYVDDGEHAGAQLVTDGRGLSVSGHEQGFFLGGCLFDRVTPQMRIWREEIFGPVLCVVRSTSFDEALEIVNHHPYGNGVSVYTRDGGAARQFASRVQAGMVGVNVPIPVPMAFYSFGGWKQSAFGDHNQHGMDGVRFFTKLKTVTARWPQEESGRGSDFSMPVMK